MAINKKRKFKLDMFSHRIEMNRGDNKWIPHSYHLDIESAEAWLETCHDVSKIFDDKKIITQYKIVELKKKESDDGF